MECTFKVDHLIFSNQSLKNVQKELSTKLAESIRKQRHLLRIKETCNHDSSEIHKILKVINEWSKDPNQVYDFVRKQRNKIQENIHYQDRVDRSQWSEG